MHLKHFRKTHFLQPAVPALELQHLMPLKDDKGFSILIISKLIEGNYPNYRQVIPAESKERISLIREEFLQALRRAEIMTSEKSNSVKLNFTKNNLSITANTPEVGEGRESLAINYKGKDFAVAFNPAYLMDPLKALETDEIFFELTDELSPGVVKINGPFLYVIMPMRMSWSEKFAATVDSGELVKLSRLRAHEINHHCSLFAGYSAGV